jgi:hypothetical protein
LQVTQNKLVFAFLEFPDSFRGAGGGVDVIATGFQNRLSSEPRGRIVVH